MKRSLTYVLYKIARSCWYTRATVLDYLVKCSMDSIASDVRVQILDRGTLDTSVVSDLQGTIL